MQSPGGTRDDVAKALGVKPEEMTLHTTLLGGGFGRKSKCDFAIEAALLSKEMGGAPVKVVWTREDDIRHGFYHTVTAERFEAGLDAANKVIAWRHRSAAPSFMANFVPDPKHPSDIELGMGWVDTPFNVPNIRMESGEAQSHVRVGWFRSVNNVTHAWSIQSFIAELAAQLGKDPKDFLLEMIGPPRIVDPCEVRSRRHWWDYGEPCADLSRSTPAACARWRSWRPRRPAGASRCRKARGSASPRTAASSATSPPWCTSRSATRARSPSRASTRRSIAASACIPSGCARRSKAQP